MVSALIKLHAILMSLRLRKRLGKVIIHFDQGSQYGSDD